MSLSPFQIAQRLQRSRDWHLIGEGRARMSGQVGEVALHADAVTWIDRYLAEVGFDPRSPLGPRIA